jgi:alpha-glucuronidase
MCHPGFHYGVFPEGYEYDHWGIYQFPNRDGFGLDRTSSGTGYTSQYPPEVAKLYENPDICPEEFLAFFHFVRYDRKLKNGKTVIQNIYDTHFSGVEKVEEYISAWRLLKEKIDSEHWKNVADRLEEQHRSAIDWRDFLNTYYHRFSGADDEKGRLIYR